MRMDACLEVAVAGQHRAGNRIGLVDRLLEARLERAGRTDTGCAGIARNGKAKPSSASCSPSAFRYSLTTIDPGVSEVFTHGLVISPRATAFRASRPALMITPGLEVLVHEVIAAMTTLPSAGVLSSRASRTASGALP